MYRVGVVKYLLGRPLVYGLERQERSDVQLVNDVPSAIAEQLLAGELDAGLIPVVELLQADDLYAVDGPCVACEGPVESIRLYHKCPLEQVCRLAVDTSSKTSAILSQLILREKYGSTPECVPCPPDLEAMLNDCDAALLIGDPALLASSRWPFVDLGDEWRTLTSLPFVFALWALREPDYTLAGILRSAWIAGTLAIECIANEEASTHGLCAQDLRRYLGESLQYDLDGRKLCGLRRFVQLAEHHGLFNSRGRWLALVS